MTMSCMLSSCKSRYGCINSRNEKVTFHKFPHDQTIRNLWIYMLSCDDGWTPKTYHRVCSKHFTDASFSAVGKYRRLKENAIPTLLLPLETSNLSSSIESSHSTSSITAKCVTDTTPTDNSNDKSSEHQPHITSPIPSKCMTVKPSYSSNGNCAEHHHRIIELEKKVVKLETLAKRRLNKIHCLRQHCKRLKRRQEWVDIAKNGEESDSLSVISEYASDYASDYE